MTELVRKRIKNVTARLEAYKKDGFNKKWFVQDVIYNGYHYMLANEVEKDKLKNPFIVVRKLLKLANSVDNNIIYMVCCDWLVKNGGILGEERRTLLDRIRQNFQHIKRPSTIE